MKKKKVYLTLQNGEVFKGYRFGAEGDVLGELVFSTSMVGYMETLTDPCNYGQVVVQTFPLIGNYGKIEADAESDRAWPTAYIVREICETPSNFRSEGALGDYLKAQGVVGVYGVDTRHLTKILREEGAMNIAITDKPLDDDGYDKLASYSVSNAVKNTAPTESKTYGTDDAEYTVALWNFGSKNSAIEALVKRGCKVVSLPYTATAEEVLEINPDGVVIGEGAGDPEECRFAVSEIKKVLGKKPVFGVGLGHQLIAMAFGAETTKSKYGHRGASQPVRFATDKKVYISAQNHGYEVIPETVKTGKISFVNVNDGSCEGIDYDEYQAFTVQFTPESCDAGNVKNPLYEKFFDLMKKEK